MRIFTQLAAPHRVNCTKDQAETVAATYAESLRTSGLLVAFWRVVWQEGTAIIVVHHRGRRRRLVLSKAVALRVQQGQAPSLFADPAA